jgi:hypothetical protein
MQYNDYLIKIEIKFVHFYSCLSYFVFFLIWKWKFLLFLIFSASIIYFIIYFLIV